MSFGLSDSIHRLLTQVFENHAGIEKVLIFGSRAKGTGKPGSDIDLAVFAPNMSDEEFARLWQEVESLDLIFKIDLLHFERVGNDALKTAILRDGRPFCEPRKMSA